MNNLHFGVVIGINRYPAISNLNFARSDAEDFYQWLIDPKLGAVPKENVVLITVSDAEMPAGTARQDAKPTRTQIKNALFTLWQTCNEHIAAHPKDWEKTRLYVFSSGHGIAPTPPEAALLMADAWAHDYTNFPYDKFINFFRAAQPFKELVFFADFCRERRLNVPLLGPSWTHVDKHNGNLLLVRGYASYFGERAFEEENNTHENPDDLRGYFTKALLEGLNGQAADPQTHEIDAISLGVYVTKRVEKLTSHRRKPQIPFFVPEPLTPPIVFRRNVPVTESHATKTHLVRITFPVGFNETVQMFNGSFQKEGNPHQASDTIWEVPLLNGFYQIKTVQGDAPFKSQGIFAVIGEDTNVKL